MKEDNNYYTLKVIRENTIHYDIIEEKIKEIFKEYIFLPLIYAINLKETVLKNSLPTPLEQAISSSRIYFSEGRFYGKFNSTLSKELLSYGAKWDVKSQTYKIREAQLPFEIRNAISLSKFIFQGKLQEIDRLISQIPIDEIADKINISSQFDSTLWDVEKQFRESVNKITVAPQLNDEQRKKIADEWQNNLRLDFKKYVTEEQIPKLREVVQENVFAGNRRENLIQGFIDTYGASQNKAKFWAHQETNLMLAKYKESKYVAAGIPNYKWGCVKMPHQSSPQAIYKAGEVRYSHGILEGKIFSWNDPPVTTPPGQFQRRNNPGQDYNCRCFAIPVARFN